MKDEGWRVNYKRERKARFVDHATQLLQPEASGLRPKAFFVLLFALALFAGFFDLGRRDVVEDNEGQRATPPVEMLRTGDFVIPTLNGKPYLSKPPLIYWAIAATYTATGSISPLTARIPAVVCYAALVLCVYAIARRGLGEMAARWGALATLATPYIFDRARYAELDIPLTLATFLAMVAFRAACESRRAGRTLCCVGLAGIAMGAAIMLKGPVPFLFLAAAWLAQTLVAGPESMAWIRPGIRWTLAMFVIGGVLWLLGLIGITPGFPLALTGLAGGWMVLAWRHGSETRVRCLAIFLGVCGLGIAVAAPWAIAVLAREGWPFVDHLLHSEVLERTHTATRINGGSPLYYFIGLVGMLAPWGLLLPCQFSKKTFEGGSSSFRFCLLTGWLSVFIFSLIAGKEYEYVLPGIPFLLMAMGVQLAVLEESAMDDWSTRWVRVWRDLMPVFLSVLALGFLIVVVLKSRFMLAHAAALTAAAFALAYYGSKHEARRLFCVVVMSICVVFLWTFSQNYRHLGPRSPKIIAAATGDLLRAGYDVEAVKMTSAFDVFPGFAFYARTVVPTVTDAEHIHAKLAGSAPYYCVLRADALKQAAPPEDAKFATPLLGPYTSKKLILIGNRPLPALNSGDTILNSSANGFRKRN